MGRRFVGRLEAGHKGDAVIVPFDPQAVWGRKPVDVVSPQYGKRAGHLVQGTLNGHPFEGWIGNRWNRYFLIVDEDLQRAAGIAAGDDVEVVVEPRS
jgi:hypothetical protein